MTCPRQYEASKLDATLAKQKRTGCAAKHIEHHTKIIRIIDARQPFGCNCPQAIPTNNHEAYAFIVGMFLRADVIKMFEEDVFSDGPISLPTLPYAFINPLFNVDYEQRRLEDEQFKQHPGKEIVKNWEILKDCAMVVNQWCGAQNITSKSFRRQWRLAKAIIKLREGSCEIWKNNPGWIQLEVYEALKNGGKTIEIERAGETELLGKYEKLKWCREELDRASCGDVEDIIVWAKEDIDNVLSELKREEGPAKK